jgi:hypothetical protein
MCIWTAANILHRVSKARYYCSWDFMTTEKLQIGLRLEPLHLLSYSDILMNIAVAFIIHRDQNFWHNWSSRVNQACKCNNTEWLGSILLPLLCHLLAIRKRKWGLWDHRVCVTLHFNLWTSWFSWNFVWALCHFSISNTMSFQVPTDCNKNMVDRQTCEVGSRLYEFWLGKAQPRSLLAYKETWNTHLLSHSGKTHHLSVVAFASIQNQQKMLKPDFLYGDACSEHHVFFTISTEDSDVYLILMWK